MKQAFWLLTLLFSCWIANPAEASTTACGEGASLTAFERVLSLVQPTKADAASCVGPGGKCEWGSDCCNRDCRSGYCNKGNSCVDAGGRCEWGSDCCNRDCRNGYCHKPGNACVGKGGRCEWGSDCCSRDCRSGSCR